jgi:hypothetical protein
MTEEGRFSLMLAFLAVTGVDIGLVYWRYKVWSDMVRLGVQVPGLVTSLEKVSEGFSIKVSYAVDGREITENRIVGGLMPRPGKMVKQGEKVTVLADSRHPERYIILDMYLKPGV